MRFPLVLLAASALLLPSAVAGHCTTWSTSVTDDTQIVVEFPADAVFRYLVMDKCAPDCLFSVWVYPEANGIAGLQRGDEMRDDTCHGMIEADVLVGW